MESSNFIRGIVGGLFGLVGWGLVWLGFTYTPPEPNTLTYTVIVKLMDSTDPFHPDYVKPTFPVPGSEVGQAPEIKEPHGPIEFFRHAYIFPDKIEPNEPPVPGGVFYFPKYDTECMITFYEMWEVEGEPGKLEPRNIKVILANRQVVQISDINSLEPVKEPNQNKPTE